MISANAVEFYSAIRKDPTVIAHLSAAETEAELIDRIEAEATKRGSALSEADIRQGFDHLDEVIRRSAGEGELTETELEIVSGGTLFETFLQYGGNPQKGKKWGSYETGMDGQIHYFNSAGCMTDKATFLKMNA